MRRLLSLAALLFAPAAHAQTLDDMQWLKGCWRTSGDGPQITEVWSAPPMPAMVGYAYTVENGEVQSWEHMRIEVIEGIATFVAMPGGGAPVRFQMLPSEQPIFNDEPPDGVASFVNAEHDYPQRVFYVRRGRHLNAVISAMDGSNRATFEYRRISCTSALRP